jgi:N-acetylglutamate synthase-like GNAT family acetyltransferase
MFSGENTHNKPMTVRPAHVEDAPRICEIVNECAERGLMLHRSLESAYASLREFLVSVDDG